MINSTAVAARDVPYSPLLEKFNIQRGPYGEIIPPPLYQGIRRDDAVDELALAVKKASGETLVRPKKGKAKAGLERLAALYAHQRRMVEALSGTLSDPIAIVLCILIDDEREPMSLRPAFLDELHHLSFVPIMQKMDETTWRIGLDSGHGRTSLFQADSISTAYAHAQETYNLWADDEVDAWKTQMKKEVKSMRPDAHTLAWEISLKNKNHANIAPGYLLERWGGHGQYALYLPTKQYFTFSAHNFSQATLLIRAMMRQKSGVKLPDIHAKSLYDALNNLLPEIHQNGQNGFVCGEIVAVIKAPKIEIFRRNRTNVAPVGYMQIRDGSKYELYTKKGATKAPKLAHTIVLPTDWDGQASMQVSILWAFFSLL